MKFQVPPILLLPALFLAACAVPQPDGETGSTAAAPTQRDAPQSGLRGIVNPQASPRTSSRPSGSTAPASPFAGLSKLFGAGTEADSFIGFPIQRVAAINGKSQILLGAFDQNGDRANLNLLDKNGKTLNQLPLDRNIRPRGAAAGGDSKTAFHVLLSSGHVVLVEGTGRRLRMAEDLGRVPNAVDIAVGPEGQVYAASRTGSVFVYEGGWNRKTIGGKTVREIIALDVDPETGEVAILGRLAGSPRIQIIHTDASLGGATAKMLPASVTNAADIATGGESTIAAYQQGGWKLGVFDKSGNLLERKSVEAVSALAMDAEDGSVWIVGPSGQLTRQPLE